MTRLELLQRLKELQQMPKYEARDITTVSAMLSREALARHVEVCEMALQPPAPKAAATSKAGH